MTQHDVGRSLCGFSGLMRSLESAPMKHSSADNLIAIQVLRCVAAVAVVVWHSQLVTKLFANNYWPAGDAAFRAAHFPFWANHLAAGVDLFFCISGFIMCMLAERAKPADAGRFIMKRIVRIIPPYWLFTTVVVGVYLISPKFNLGQLSGDWNNDAVLILKSFFLVPQPDPPVLGVGWTLIHEFLFYALVCGAILLNLGRRLALVLGCVALVAIGLGLARQSLLYGYGLSPYMVEFFLGALAFRLRDRVSPMFPRLQLCAALGLYLATSLLLDRDAGSPHADLIQVFGFGLMGFLTISGALGVSRAASRRESGPLRFLARVGDASYSLYLSHWFVLSMLGKCAALMPDAPALLVVLWQVTATATTIVVALMFADYAELPIHRRLLGTSRMAASDAGKNALSATLAGNPS